MALLESDAELLQLHGVDPTLLSAVYHTETEDEEPFPEIELDLEGRFASDRISDLSEGFLETSFGPEWRKEIGDRQFVIGVMPATSEFADVPKMVETTRFAEQFKRPMSRVFCEYAEHDPSSTFLVAIDVNAERPTPAGAVRIIEPNETKGLKSINDFVDDKPGNPWIAEIKKRYFAEGEDYSPLEAWERMCNRVGVDLDPSESHDVATIAVLDKYATDGEISGTSIALYHSVLRYALGNDIKNLVSIQDIRPLQILQKFGNCFSFFEDIDAHPYGGPFDTIPAWAELQEGMRRVRSSGFGNVFIEGEGIDQDYYLLKDYAPEQYSDKAVQLGEYLPETN